MHEPTHPHTHTHTRTKTHPTPPANNLPHTRMYMCMYTHTHVQAAPLACVLPPTNYPDQKKLLVRLDVSLPHHQSLQTLNSPAGSDFALSPGVYLWCTRLYYCNVFCAGHTFTNLFIVIIGLWGMLKSHIHHPHRCGRLLSRLMFVCVYLERGFESL